MSAALPNPTPSISPDTEEFWSATAEGRLLLRHCDDCDTIIWYPRPFCPACGRFNTSWVEASGKGKVYAFTIVYRNGMPGWRDALPYVVAYVELDEGPRVLTNIVGCEPDAVRIEMPVHVVFQDTGQGNAVFRFEPDA
ncbi:MAG: Zn-ribbon domain-containing OB-fold protein [Acidimicrobiales bacterium]